MNVLAIDTAANLCAACIYETGSGRVTGRRSEDIGVGHAEALMGMIAQALAQAGLTYRELGGIAVSIGPGSFTGIRIGVAAARGLALALKLSSKGVSTLDALAFEAAEAHPGRPILAAIDARRGQVYASLFDAGGAPVAGPTLTDLETARGMALDNDAIVAGSAAEMVTRETKLTATSGGRTADIAIYARMAAAAGFAGPRPKPLYLRSADAKPQAGFTLPMRAPGGAH